MYMIPPQDGLEGVLPLDPVHHTDLRSTLQKLQAGERGNEG